jgi:hypothetical protein
MAGEHVKVTVHLMVAGKQREKKEGCTTAYTLKRHASSNLLPLTRP